MIFEKWNTGFDMSLLKNHLETYVLPLEPVAQSASFAGWSVLSSDGSYRDGWHKGHLALTPGKTEEEMVAHIRRLGGKPIDEYKVPTEICHGYLNEVMEYLISFKLEPRRARIIRLSPRASSIWHRDASDGEYAVRLHVPLITNAGCFFETRGERDHLAADGSSYFLFVNREHRVVNEGDTHRYHLVMDVWDRTGVSHFHRSES